MLLGRVGIIKPQITQAAKFLGNAKIQTDGFGVTNVQVPIRLRRKPGMYSLTKSSSVLIGSDQSPNKIDWEMVFRRCHRQMRDMRIPHVTHSV
jgi:hypothetical protein